MLEISWLKPSIKNASDLLINMELNANETERVLLLKKKILASFHVI